MEPFGIAAGAFGITSFAINNITQLHGLINSLATAKENVADVASDLQNIQRVLTALNQLSVPDEATSLAIRADLQAVGVAQAVNTCGAACSEFSRDLEKWTSHSSNPTEKLSKRDRLSVGLWNQEKIRTYKIRVHSCATIVGLAVKAISFNIQIRSETLSELDRMSMRAFQTETQQSFNQLKQEFNDVTQRLHALQLEPRADRDEVSELEAQRAALEEGQVSCAVMTAQAKSMRSNQTISEIVTSGESKVHIGMSESVVARVNQRITKVTTGTGSRAVIGNFGNDYRMSDF